MKFMKKFEIILFLKFPMRLRRILYFALFVVVSTIFFSSFFYYIETKQFSALAAVCIPVLAVLFGFSSLLYNRARALPSGKEQRRSLYAAERAMQSTLLFLFGATIGGIGALIVWVFFNIGNLEIHPYWKIFTSSLFCFSILLIVYSFSSFFMALRTVGHKLFKWLPMRKLVKSLK